MALEARPSPMAGCWGITPSLRSDPRDWSRRGPDAVAVSMRPNPCLAMKRDAAAAALTAAAECSIRRR